MKARRKVPMVPSGLAVDEARAYVKAHEDSTDPVVNMMRRLLARFDYIVAQWKDEEQDWLRMDRTKDREIKRLKKELEER